MQFRLHVPLHFLHAAVFTYARTEVCNEHRTTSLCFKSLKICSVTPPVFSNKTGLAFWCLSNSPLRCERLNHHLFLRTRSGGNGLGYRRGITIVISFLFMWFVTKSVRQSARSVWFESKTVLSSIKRTYYIEIYSIKLLNMYKFMHFNCENGLFQFTLSYCGYISHDSLWWCVQRLFASASAEF